MFRVLGRFLPFLALAIGWVIMSNYHVESSSSAVQVQSARVGWQKFQAEHGQQWRATWTNDGRLQTLRGARYRAIAGTPSEVAHQFLLENAGLFQLKGDLSDLTVVRVTNSLSGNHVELQQTYSGLPVIDGTIEVHSDNAGRVFLIHNNYVPSINARPVAVRSEKDSLDIAIRNFQLYTAPSRAKIARVLAVTNELGIYETAQGPQVVHRIVLRSEPLVIAREYLIGDETGTVMKQRPLVLDSVTGKGKVFDPNPVNTLNDPSLTDQDDSDKAVPAGAYFVKDLLELNNAVAGHFSLTGPYVKMEDIESPSNTPPSLTDKDAFTFTRSDDNFEEVMCYFHIDRNQRYIQSLGFNNINNRQHRIDAHGVNGEDNSHYLADPVGAGYLAFGDGGVDDAEDADVILHEYGHSIQDNSSNGKYLAGGEAGAMGEGFGDYWAATNSPSGFDVACIAEWDTHPCLRRVDGTKHYPEAISGEVHADGEIWSATLWEIRQALGKSIADKLILESHFLIAANPKFKDGARALLDADEMLFNGDHVDVICDKTSRRGILGCLDLIFVIDTTGSMFDDIDAVKAAATDIVNALDSKNLDYRMAIVNYEDFPVSPYGEAGCGDQPFHDALAFSDNKTQIIAGIQGLSLRCGADIPEAVFSALTHAIESTSLGSWRNNLTKAVILMGDAPGHNPEPFTGYTPASVIAAAEAADPVKIFPVAIGFDQEMKTQFATLAQGTGGQVFAAPTAKDVVAAILAAIDAIVTPGNCVLTCPNNVVQSNMAGQCGAVVNYPSPTVNGTCGTVTCSPASGSFFPVGMTTVTCTSSVGPACSFTVTVSDSELPHITCPAPITAVTAKPGDVCLAVPFTVVATDNCPGVTSACTLSNGTPVTSGYCFPKGASTVTCKATDASGNMSTCSFIVTVFDMRLQDDSNPGMVLLWNSVTGSYRFCGCGPAQVGTGKAINKGNVYTLDQSSGQTFRILATCDATAKRGTASFQRPPGSTVCTITDRDISNNTSVCQ